MLFNLKLLYFTVICEQCNIQYTSILYLIALHIINESIIFLIMYKEEEETFLCRLK